MATRRKSQIRLCKLSSQKKSIAAKRFKTVGDALFAGLGKSYAEEKIPQNEENRRRILERIASLRSVLDGAEENVKEASALPSKHIAGVAQANRGSNAYACGYLDGQRDTRYGTGRSATFNSIIEKSKYANGYWKGRAEIEI